MQSVLAHRSSRSADASIRGVPSRHASPIPRWRAYRDALIASFANGRWQLTPFEQPSFSQTLIEVEEIPRER